MNRQMRALRLLFAALVFSGLLLGSATSYAVGTFKFCGRYAYTYRDQGLNEDYLLHESGNTFGVVATAYSRAQVDKNGGAIWSGNLDSVGCTPAFVGDAGSYRLWATADISVPGGARVTITPTSAGTPRWFSSTWQLNAVTTAWTLWANFGQGDTTASAAAAVERILAVPDNGFVAGSQYFIYTEVAPGGTSTSGNKVHLAKNPQFNTWDAFWKSVVLHELGHAIQGRLFGLQARNYTAGDATQPLCRCDHVFDPNDRLHCIQSREHGGTAQLEGFGHFVAAVAVNRLTDNDAWFPYYKNVLYTDNVNYPPPIGFTVAGWKWMENRGCQIGNGGVELDWMSFYYWVHRPTADAYTFAQIGAVYRKACANANCTGSIDTTWGTLRSATDSLYGASSTKAVYWRNQGDIYGVDW